jgi:hypothetical protein
MPALIASRSDHVSRGDRANEELRVARAGARFTYNARRRFGAHMWRTRTCNADNDNEWADVVLTFLI